MSVQKITDTEMFAENLKIDGAAIIDFNAVWCPPCRHMEPIFEALSNQIPEVRFLSLDVDEVRSVGQEFNIMSIPTFALIKIKDGKYEVVNKLIGAQDPLFLKQEIQNLLK